MAGGAGEPWLIRSSAFRCGRSIRHRIQTHEIFLMEEVASSDSFAKLVEWAYSTLPEKIRDLPDFPGIHVVDEPPDGDKGKLAPGKELLGLYRGVRRTERRFNTIRKSPDLIFVFRGPIQRCSRGDLRAEVKQVVWHEVAHWLGHNEEEVKDLGLSAISPRIEGVANQLLEDHVNGVDIIAASKTARRQLSETFVDATEQPLRCLSCYSADVTCRELLRSVTDSSAWLSDPIPVLARICTCKACGLEWDDEDNE